MTLVTLVLRNLYSCVQQQQRCLFFRLGFRVEGVEEGRSRENLTPLLFWQHSTFNDGEFDARCVRHGNTFWMVQ